ncbi:MAG: PKD domain-containing protein [Methanobacteriota archaeon]
MGASSQPGSAPGGAQAPGSKKPLVLIVVAVVIVAVLAGAAYVLLSAPPTTPPAEPTLDRLTVSAARTTIDQREEVQVTAVAYNTDNVDVTANASIAWSASPSTRVQGASGTGSSKTVTAIQAGSVAITATATLSGVTRSDVLNVTILALSLEVTPSTTTPNVNEDFDLTVRVLRSGVAATSYRGTVAFTSDDTLATLPVSRAFDAGDAGVRVFSGVRVGQARLTTITVRDTVADIVGTATVTGQRPANAPVASFALSRDLMQISVDASGSTDPDNDIATYAWAWGDGQTAAPSASPLASHTYATPDRYTVVLTVTDAFPNSDASSQKVTVGPSTLDWEFYDFFKEPFQEYWDVRTVFYPGELPINAECFNATSITYGICVPTDTNVPDTPSYPYTHWWSSAGPGSATATPYAYARYRFNVLGRNVSGYTLSEPVFLPVMNYSAPPGTRLDVDWQLSYMDTRRVAQVMSECSSNFGFGDDGYFVESQITLIMDLDESKRIFGVVAADAAEATTWWETNTNPVCKIYNRAETGPAERALVDWLVLMGGSQTSAGKYDIATGYEWYYDPKTMNMTASVDPTTGLTTVRIYHVAYGTEVLLARWFYWGNASYLDNHLDSTKREGWNGQEVAWYEDFSFQANLRPDNFNFTLDTSLAYHFQEICGPGTNGLYDRVDDVGYWQWGPTLDDYIHDFQVKTVSELDRYTTQTYTQCSPGSPTTLYGQTIDFDLTPITWDLPAGHSWTFRLPSGNVVFYDPNLTPAGANPIAGQFVEIRAPMVVGSTAPSPLGDWDATTLTLTVLGPVVTGGPDGSPGNYPLSPFPMVNLTQGPTSAPPAAPARTAGEGTSAGSDYEAGFGAVVVGELVGEGGLAAARNSPEPYLRRSSSATSRGTRSSGGERTR